MLRIRTNYVQVLRIVRLSLLLPWAAYLRIAQAYPAERAKLCLRIVCCSSARACFAQAAVAVRWTACKMVGALWSWLQYCQLCWPEVVWWSDGIALRACM